jgi:hypothetical protein
MTDHVTKNRAARLASWIAKEGWSIEEVRRETEDVYRKEDLDRPRRFAIVEHLELPGHDERIVSTTDTEEEAASRLVSLMECAWESSWYPRAVLDLDTDDVLEWTLSVHFTRATPDD